MANNDWALNSSISSIREAAKRIQTKEYKENQQKQHEYATTYFNSLKRSSGGSGQSAKKFEFELVKPQQVKFSWSDKYSTKDMSFSEYLAWGQHTGKDSSFFEQAMAATLSPSSRYYNPYFNGRSTQTTAQAFFRDNLGYTGAFDDQFFTDFQWLRQYETRSDLTGSIQSPGNSGTPEQWAAYWYTQLLMDRDIQNEVDGEWHDLRTTAQKWYHDYETIYGKAPTIDEFLGSIDMDDYNQLAKIDASRNLGTVDSSAVVQLNLGTNYSRENLYGLYYALSQGRDISEDRNYFEDAVSYYAQPISAESTQKAYDWQGQQLDASSPELQAYMANLRENGNYSEYAALQNALYLQSERMDSMEGSDSFFGGDYKDDEWFADKERIFGKYPPELGDGSILSQMLDANGDIVKPKSSDDMIYQAAYEYYVACQRRVATDAVEDAWQTYRELLMEVAAENPDASAEDLRDAFDERAGWLGYTDDDNPVNFVALEDYLSDPGAVQLCRPTFISKEAQDRLFELAAAGVNVSASENTPDYALLAYETAGEAKEEAADAAQADTTATEIETAAPEAGAVSAESSVLTPATIEMVSEMYAARFGEFARDQMLATSESNEAAAREMITAMGYTIEDVQPSTESEQTTSLPPEDIGEPPEETFDPVLGAILDEREAQDAINAAAAMRDRRTAMVNSLMELSLSNIPISTADIERSGMAILPDGDEATLASLANLWLSANGKRYGAQLGEGYTPAQAAAIDPVFKALGGENAQAQPFKLGDLEEVCMDVFLSEAGSDGATMAGVALDATVPGALSASMALTDLQLMLGDAAQPVLDAAFDAARYAEAYQRRTGEGADEATAAREALAESLLFADMEAGIADYAAQAPDDTDDFLAELCTPASIDRVTAALGGSERFLEVYAKCGEAGKELLSTLLIGLSPYCDEATRAATEDLLHDLESGEITVDDVIDEFTTPVELPVFLPRENIPTTVQDIEHIIAPYAQRHSALVSKRNRIKSIDEEIAELEAQAQESLATSESEATFQQKEFERQNLDLDLANGVISADEYDAAVLALEEKYDPTIDKNTELNERIIALQAEKDGLQSEVWFEERALKYEAIPRRDDFREVLDANEYKPVMVNGKEATPVQYNEYAFINDIGDSREQMLHDGTGSYAHPEYVYMTDDERDIYNYLYHAEGEESAKEYLGYVKYFCDERMVAAQDERLRGIVNESAAGTVGMNVVSVIAAPFRLGGALEAFWNSLRNKFGGEYRPLNMNSAAQSIGRGIDSIRDQTSQNIAGQWMIGGFDAGQFVYNTGMSAGDSLFAGVITGGAAGGSAILGLSSAQSTMTQLYDEGATEQQIFLGGLAAGTFETLFEKVSLGAFFDSAQDVTKAGIRDIVKDFFIQTGVNASEEASTEIANIVFDYWNRGEDSDYGQAVRKYMDEGLSEGEARSRACGDMAMRVLESAGSGAFMGGGFSMIGSASRAVGQHAMRAEAGASAAESAQIAQFLEDARAGRHGARAQSMAAGFGEDKPSAAQLGVLVNAAYQNQSMNMYAAMREGVKDVLADLGYEGDADAVADEAVRQIQQNAQTEAARKSEQQQTALAASAEGALQKATQAGTTAQEQASAEAAPESAAEAAATQAEDNGGATEDSKTPPVDILLADEGQTVSNASGLTPLAEAVADRVILRMQRESGQIDEAEFAKRGEEVATRILQEAQDAELPSSGIQFAPISTYPAEKQADIRAYLGAVDEDVLSFANRYISDPQAKFDRMKIGDVGEREAADVQTLLGIDVGDYTHNIDKNAIRHIDKRHGKSGEADSSMTDANDIARVGWVLQNYDSVDILKDQNGNQVFSKGYLDSQGNPAPMLIYTKQIDGTYYVAEVVADNKWKKLWVVSAYSNPKNGEENTSPSLARQQTPDVQAPWSTSETVSAPGLTQKPVSSSDAYFTPEVTSETASGVTSASDTSAANTSIAQDGGTVNGETASQDEATPRSKVRALADNAAEVKARSGDLREVERTVWQQLVDDTKLASQLRSIKDIQTEIDKLKRRDEEMAKQYNRLTYGLQGIYSAAYNNGIDPNSPKIMQAVQNKLREIESVMTDRKQLDMNMRDVSEKLSQLSLEYNEALTSMQDALYASAMEEADEKRRKRMENIAAQKADPSLRHDFDPSGRPANASQEMRSPIDPDVDVQQAAKHGRMIEVGEALFTDLLKREKAKSGGYVNKDLFEKHFTAEPAADPSESALSALLGSRDVNWKVLAENDRYILVRDRTVESAKDNGEVFLGESDMLASEKREAQKLAARLRARLASRKGEAETAAIRAELEQTNAYITRINERLKIPENSPKIFAFDKEAVAVGELREVESRAQEAGLAAVEEAEKRIEQANGFDYEAFPELRGIPDLEQQHAEELRQFVLHNAYETAHGDVLKAGMDELRGRMICKSFTTAKNAASWAKENDLAYEGASAPNRFFVEESLLYQDDADVFESERNERMTAEPERPDNVDVEKALEIGEIPKDYFVADNRGAWALLVKKDTSNKSLIANSGQMTMSSAYKLLERAYTAILEKKQNAEAWNSEARYQNDGWNISYLMRDADTNQWSWKVLGERDAQTGERAFTSLENILENAAQVKVKYYAGKDLDFRIVKDAQGAVPSVQGRAYTMTLRAKMEEAKRLLLDGRTDLTASKAKEMLRTYFGNVRLLNDKTIYNYLTAYRNGSVVSGKRAALLAEVQRLRAENETISGILRQIDNLREEVLAASEESPVHRLDRETEEGGGDPKDGGGALLKAVEKEQENAARQHEELSKDDTMLDTQRGALLKTLADYAAMRRKQAEALRAAGVTEEKIVQAGKAHVFSHAFPGAQHQPFGVDEDSVHIKHNAGHVQSLGKGRSLSGMR